MEYYKRVTEGIASIRSRYGDRKKEKELTQREIRRKRRIRNQLIAYLSMGAALCLIIVACVFGVKTVVEKIQEDREMKEMAKQLEEMSQAEEPEVIEEIDTETVEIEEYTQEDLLEEVVDSCISEMTLEEKVAGAVYHYAGSTDGS